MHKTFNIDGTLVGPEHPVFTIAEIGSNHGQDKEIVRELICAAASAGFNAVKFQTYDAAEIFSKLESTVDVGLDHIYGIRPWWEIARDVILMPRDWFAEMYEFARAKSLIPFATAHSASDLKFLSELGVSVIKIASIDLHYHEFIRHVAELNKPILLSTGMAFFSEIDETVRLLEEAGCKDLGLLHCISCYPPKPEDVHLRNIPTLQATFQCPIGYSDHSAGITTAIGAVALGARIIEKHITLDKNSSGPDHPFAIEPKEMETLVDAIREIDLSLGSATRRLSSSDTHARSMIRRSIVARSPIKKGRKINIETVKFARPGTGLSPNEFQYINGLKACIDIEAETVIQWSMIEK